MMHLRFARFTMILVAAGMPASSLNADPGAPVPFRVVGYLPDYRWNAFDFDSVPGLTDLIVFSVEPNADGTLNRDRLTDCPWDELRAFKGKQNVRLFLTLGGWGRSTHFGVVTKSTQRRKKLVDAVVQIALGEQLDGIDLDWEHPVNTAEQNAYGQLLADLRAALEPHGVLLTVTVAAWQPLSPMAIEAVNEVQLMAYDHSDQHATFQGAQADVRVLIDAGVPVEKIVLGLPFYGRDVQDRNATAYRDIVADFGPAPEIDQVANVYFNGPATIGRKVEFAIESRLGGVMVWELSQDAPGQWSLLRAIRETVSNSIP